MASFTPRLQRSNTVDDWVDYTHATTYEAFIAAVEVIAKNKWNLNGQGVASPSVLNHDDASRKIVEMVKYDNVMWSLSFHCDNRLLEVNHNMASNVNNSRDATLKWKDASLKHLTPTMLSLLDAPGTFLQSDLSYKCHTVQRLFGVKDFIMLNPPSLSNSIFIPPSLSKFLLHGVALALHNINCTIPVFTTLGAVPDYIGIAVPAQYGGKSIKFSSKKQMRKPSYEFSNLSITTSSFLSKLGATSVNTKPVNITVRHSWGYAVSAAKATRTGNSRRNSNINNSGKNGSPRGSNGDNNNDGNADVRSWWRSPGEWGPLDDPIHSVTVYTIWPRFKSGTFVDNDSYTDLIASQAPEWYIRATFNRDLDLPIASKANALITESNEEDVHDEDNKNNVEVNKDGQDIEEDEDEDDDEFKDACATVEEQESLRRKICKNKMDTIRSANSPAITNIDQLPIVKEALREESDDIYYAEKILTLATALLAHFPFQFRLVNEMLDANGKYPVQVISEAERRSIERATAPLDEVVPHHKEYILRLGVTSSNNNDIDGNGLIEPARMYVFSSNNEIRVCTALTEDF